MSSSTQDPSVLEWHLLALTNEKVMSLWKKFQDFPKIFDDITKGDFNSYLRVLLDRRSLVYELGNEVGIAAATEVVPGINANFHLVMLDRKLAGRESLIMWVIRDIFDKLALRRLTVAFPHDRATTKKLYERLGFRREGRLRSFFPYENELKDLLVYGILKEEL